MKAIEYAFRARPLAEKPQARVNPQEYWRSVLDALHALGPDQALFLEAPEDRRTGDGMTRMRGQVQHAIDRRDPGVWQAETAPDRSGVWVSRKYGVAQESSAELKPAVSTEPAGSPPPPPPDDYDEPDATGPASLLLDFTAAELDDAHPALQHEAPEQVEGAAPAMSPLAQVEVPEPAPASPIEHGVEERPVIAPPLAAPPPPEATPACEDCGIEIRANRAAGTGRCPSCAAKARWAQQRDRGHTPEQSTAHLGMGKQPAPVKAPPLPPCECPPGWWAESARINGDPERRSDKHSHLCPRHAHHFVLPPDTTPLGEAGHPEEGLLIGRCGCGVTKEHRAWQPYKPQAPVEATR